VELINHVLCERIIGEQAFAIPKAWKIMVGAVRNLDWRGLCANAISAIDFALWDLEARILNQPLVQALGVMRTAVGSR
jgi:L-alanine-DL-glutamate epimerase-like enolase superfamily enzyme